MAEDNEKLQKQVGKTDQIAIKGAVTKTDTEAINEGEKDGSPNPRFRPAKLPPKHQFKG